MAAMRPGAGLSGLPMAAPRRGARLARAAAAVLACAGLGAVALQGGLPRELCAGLKRQTAPPVQFDAQDEEEPPPADAPLRAALDEAMDQVDAIGAELEDGQAPELFRERAQAVLQATPSELKPAVDGALQALFIEELQRARQELFERFERDRRPATALERADRQFVARAEELLCPGTDWSYAPERAALQAALSTAYREEAAIEQERARSAQTLRATAAVVGKMQRQMEQLGEKLNGIGTSGPWMLWTSYHIPRTPFRMSGRYQQGRANIEFSLSPNKDPANAEAGFVEGLTKQNLGLALNVGV